MAALEDITSRLDPELVPMFSVIPKPAGAPDVAAGRKRLRDICALLLMRIPKGDDVLIEDITIPGTAEAPAIPLRIFRPANRKTDNVLLWMHGGGFFAGHHEDEGIVAIEWVRAIGCTIVSVGYRMAPEHQHPAAVNDCHAALRWVASGDPLLSFTPAKIAIGGISAGGCLAAATALKARDEGGPQPCFQLLLIPALDDRNETPSFLEFMDTRTWNRNAGLAAWKIYLGPNVIDETLPYAAPARASNLSDLPPCYMEVAEIDPLRDEAISYATRLMQAGVKTELHVYPGAYHGSTFFQPQATVSQRALFDATRALQAALS
ncbi:MAG: alpha/beta hydrolase [Pseudomonadota bacterium]